MLLNEGECVAEDSSIVRCDVISPVKWLPTFQGVTVPSTSLSRCPICLSNIGMPNYLQEFKFLYVALCLWACSFGRFGKYSCLFLRFLDCLALKVKATPSYETSGTATPPTGCHIPTAVRTSNLTTTYGWHSV